MTFEVGNRRSWCVEDVLTVSIEAFGLQGPEAYAYTSMSNCLTVQDIDDVKDFGETIVRCFFPIVLLA